MPKTVLVTAPTEHNDVDPAHTPPRPWVFLAGGITGCPDWQTSICEMLQMTGLEFTVFNPRRKRFPEAKPEHTVEGENNLKRAKRIQLEWEEKYLREADCVSFWLARDGDNYVTRFELGMQLMTHLLSDPMSVDVLLGIDRHAVSQNAIRHYWQQLKGGVQIRETLLGHAQQIRAWVEFYKSTR